MGTMIRLGRFIAAGLASVVSAGSQRRWEGNELYCIRNYPIGAVSAKGADEMTVITGADAGLAEDSKFVPMGTFGILHGETHARRYLKSTGFGPCIGLALYSPTQGAGVLAHFMSLNSIPKSVVRIANKLNELGLSSKGRNWQAILFAGGQAASGKAIPMTIGGTDIEVGTVSKSNASVRLETLLLRLTSTDVREAAIQGGGFETCSLDISDGTLRLSNLGIGGTHNNSAALFALDGAPLAFDGTNMN